jgi:hypothetical protein
MIANSQAPIAEGQEPRAEGQEPRAEGQAASAEAGVGQGMSHPTGRARTLNATCFLNRTACRTFLLEHAQKTRAHKFSRVSAEALQGLNERMRQAMIALVQGLPSKGKTI